MYPQVQDSEILRSAHTVYLCTLNGFQNCKLLSPQSADWLVFITHTRSVYCAVRAECT